MTFPTAFLPVALFAGLLRSLLFAGAGLDTALIGARTPRRIPLLAGLLLLFTLPATLLEAGLIRPHLTGLGNYLPMLETVLFVAINGALFAAGMLVLSKKYPALLANLRPELCAAAWNALVLGIFMGGEASYTSNLGGAVLTVVFGCLAFLAASYLLVPVERLSNSPRVPKVFRGLPAQFLYISMICLALAGFAFGVPAQ